MTGYMHKNLNFIIINRACELGEANHVRFHHTIKIKIIL